MFGGNESCKQCVGCPLLNMINTVLPDVDLVRSCVVMASQFGSRMYKVANSESRKLL